MRQDARRKRMVIGRLGNVAPSGNFGALLRWWREWRGLSQLALAAAIDTHVVLGGRLRARLARERSLGARAATAQQRAGLHARQQEPYPAFVLDRRWNLLRANTGAARLAFLVGPPPTPAPADPVNLAVALVSSDGLRPFIVNWEGVVLHFLRGVQADAVADRPDRPGLGGRQEAVMIRVAFAGTFAASLEPRVRAHLRVPCDVVLADEASVVTRLPDVDVLVTMAFTGEMGAAASRLKLVQVPGAGLDRIDRSALSAATSLANAYGHEVGIAEYVIGVMLAMTRRFCRIDAALRRGSWVSQ
jgi:hypothetical protein